MVFMFIPKCYLRNYIQKKPEEAQPQILKQVADELDFFEDEYLFEDDIEIADEEK